jgi:hypothetical protein
MPAWLLAAIVIVLLPPSVTPAVFVVGVAAPVVVRPTVGSTHAAVMPSGEVFCSVSFVQLAPAFWQTYTFHPSAVGGGFDGAATFSTSSAATAKLVAVDPTVSPTAVTHVLCT